MSHEFAPPPLDQLSSVDMADCPYEASPSRIEGVISMGVQGGWDGRGDYCVHCFSLAAWKPVGEVVRQTELTILRPVPSGNENPPSYFRDFPELTIHRLEVLLSQDGSRAVFIAAIEKNIEDADLKAAAEDLSKPVIIETECFGSLTLSRQIDCFEGEVMWDGGMVEIILRPDDDLTVTSALKNSVALFDNVATWARRIREYAVTEVLEMANDWNVEEGRKISANEFLERMTLTVIQIDRDGGFTFLHDDGDLFWGHSIEVSGTIKDGLTNCSISG